MTIKLPSFGCAFHRVPLCGRACSAPPSPAPTAATPAHSPAPAPTRAPTPRARKVQTAAPHCAPTTRSPDDPCRWHKRHTARARTSSSATTTTRQPPARAYPLPPKTLAATGPPSPAAPPGPLLSPLSSFLAWLLLYSYARSTATVFSSPWTRRDHSATNRHPPGLDLQHLTCYFCTGK